MQKLDLNGTKVTDAGLKELKGLGRLETLFLYDTAVTDAGLKELKDFPQLQRAFDVAAVGGERPGLRFDQMEAAMKPVFNQVMNGQISPRAAVQQLDEVTKPLLAELPPAAR